MLAASLDQRDSNLPKLDAYVPLVHELAYHLAEPQQPPANIQPGSALTMVLPARPHAARPSQTTVDLEVLSPTQRRLPARAEAGPRDIVLRFDQTREDGLYHVLLPPSLRGRLADLETRRPPSSSWPTAPRAASARLATTPSPRSPNASPSATRGPQPRSSPP